MIQATKINSNYYYPEQLKDEGEAFLNAYRLEKEVGCPASKVKGLKEKTQRVCRFCGRRYPTVRFSKDAHVISELLGNRYLVSDIECDDCNLLFSKYENDLANFLGIIRTIQSVRGKKTPKFKSADQQLIAESKLDPVDGTVVSLKRFKGLNNTFHFDKEKNHTVITYEKSPYTPLNVYKAILKMALTVIDDKYLNDYKFAFEYLRSNKYDNAYSGFAMVIGYTMALTFQYERPAAMIFRKIDPAANLFTHVFSLNALNQIFQILLPFNRQDVIHYNTPSGLNTLWCPPLFGDSDEESIRHIFSNNYDLNSTQRVYNQKESFIIPGQLGDFENSQIKDSLTGEVRERNFDNVIAIELICEGKESNNK